MNLRRSTLQSLAAAAAFGLLGCGSEDESSGLIVQSAMGSVVINEALARNNRESGEIQDNYGEYDDWVELYNTGSEIADIGGFWVSDSVKNPLKTALPKDLTLAPGGRLVLWADDQTYQTDEDGIHLAFRLGAVEGDDVVLSGPEGHPIDHLVVPAQPVAATAPAALAVPVAAARCPDGTGRVVLTRDPTPGKLNGNFCDAENGS